MKQRHRIFIAVNLPLNIKKKLLEYQQKFPEVPAGWTKLENLHITLIFLGYISDQELLETCKITKKVAQKHQPFSINLKKVFYGPPGKIPSRPPKFLETVVVDEEKPVPPQKFRRPKMIWAEGKKSKEFAALKDNLEKSLIQSEKINFSLENRAFSPHITLARIRQWELRRIEPEEIPQIDENINLSFLVNSIEIMESRLKRGGVEYAVIESAPLV